MAGAVQVARIGAQLEAGALEPAKATSPINQSDNSSTILADLRAAAQNLPGMLDAEFKP